MKVQILAILTHFWQGLCLVWLWYQYQKLSMKVLVLIMAGLSLNKKKYLNNSDFLDEIADFGHFSLISACFLPVMPVMAMSKALNGYS